MIEKNKAVGKLQLLKGDSRGLVASVFDTCIQGIKEMPEDDRCIPLSNDLRKLGEPNLCDICEYGALSIGEACEVNDYNCKACSIKCPCKKCNNGSEFVWRGGKVEI